MVNHFMWWSGYLILNILESTLCEIVVYCSWPLIGSFWFYLGKFAPILLLFIETSKVVQAVIFLVLSGSIDEPVFKEPLRAF